MGSVLSFRTWRKTAEDTAVAAKESVEDMLMKERLVHLKTAKFQRDIGIATRIASTRDMVHFMGAFYVTLGVSQLIKLRVLRSGPITISQFPFFFVPYTLCYNVDLAYGNKIERLNREVHEILQNEKHWFNEPMQLPPYLEPAYKLLQEEVNEKLRGAGRPNERDWACFTQPKASDEVLDLSYPVTRILQEGRLGIEWDHAGFTPSTSTSVESEIRRRGELQRRATQLAALEQFESPRGGGGGGK